MNRRYIYWIGTLATLALALVLVNPVLLHGSSRVSLRAADPLTGQVAQALGTATTGGKLQVPGSDFVLRNTKYFEDQTWVVTTIASVGGKSNNGVAILERRNGIFQVVLGPGTEFSTSYTQSLPSSVSTYLSEQGLLYEPGD
jgi:hypothetical protein